MFPKKYYATHVSFITLCYITKYNYKGLGNINMGFLFIIIFVYFSVYLFAFLFIFKSGTVLSPVKSEFFKLRRNRNKDIGQILLQSSIFSFLWWLKQEQTSWCNDHKISKKLPQTSAPFFSSHWTDVSNHYTCGHRLI